MNVDIVLGLHGSRHAVQCVLFLEHTMAPVTLARRITHPLTGYTVHQLSISYPHMQTHTEKGERRERERERKKERAIEIERQ